jgi:hypothetical protein
VLLVEPAYARTGFDTKAIQPDGPLPIYAAKRHVFDNVMARAMAAGDDPAIVAKAIVAAATDQNRSCATPPGRRPDASAPCAVSLLRGSSTGRS